jgi:hypothetical protein
LTKFWDDYAAFSYESFTWLNLIKGFENNLVKNLETAFILKLKDRDAVEIQ